MYGLTQDMEHITSQMNMSTWIDCVLQRVYMAAVVGVKVEVGEVVYAPLLKSLSPTLNRLRKKLKRYMIN